MVHLLRSATSFKRKAATPGLSIPAALPCLALACILAVQLVAKMHNGPDENYGFELMYREMLSKIRHQVALDGYAGLWNISMESFSAKYIGDVQKGRRVLEEGCPQRKEDNSTVCLHIFRGKGLAIKPPIVSLTYLPGPTTCTDQVLLKNPEEHLARTQHWLTKEKLKADKIKSHRSLFQVATQASKILKNRFTNILRKTIITSSERWCVKRLTPKNDVKIWEELEVEVEK
ncbi:hypothetical protein BTVI_147215 [Pitangus sulphuratus]|nr:hypothetical protein BTVI_147215 [Pitangus sulphuratus]